MASRKNTARKLASPGLAGFLVPPFSLSLAPATIVEASAQGTDVGVLTVNPPNSSVTLLDSDGNKFQLNADGVTLEAGSVPLNVLNDGAASVDVRISLNTYIFEQTFPITVTAAPVTVVALAGPHTMAADAAAGTVVGALSSTPTGATFSITAQDTPNGFAIAGGNLVAGSAPLGAGTVHVTVRATRAGQTHDQQFSITVS